MNKTLLIFVFTLSFISSTLFAQLSWEQVQSPEGGSLRYICLDSTETHWGIAETGSVYKLGGDNTVWERVDVNHIYYSVRDIFCDKDGDVFILAYRQLIYSNDNGITWISLELPSDVIDVKPSFQGCFFGIGNSGRIYKSDDKGKNWQEYQNFQTGVKLSSIPSGDYFITTGYLGGTIVKTDDCGESNKYVTSKFGDEIVYVTDFKHHPEGITYVATTSKNSTLEFEINIFKKEVTDDEFVKVARYVNDTSKTQQGNPLSSEIYLRDNRTIIFAVDEQYILDTLYDNSITIIREYKTDNNLNYNPFEDLPLKGIKDKYVYEINSSNNSFYVRYRDGRYSYNKNTSKWEKEVTLLDSGFVYILGNTNEGSLFGYSYLDGYFCIYDDTDNRWAKTHSEPIHIKDNRVYYNYGKLIFQSINHDFISYNYGKSKDTLSEARQTFDGGSFSNKDYFLSPNQGFYCSLYEYKEVSENYSQSYNTHLRYFKDSNNVVINEIDIGELVGKVGTYEIKANVSPSDRLFLATHMPFKNIPLQISDDNGISFTDYSTGLSPDAKINEIVFSKNGSKTILATSDGLYLRNSSDDSWKDITPNNESRYIRDVVLLDNSTIYAVDYNGNLYSSNILLSVDENKELNNSVNIYPNPTSSSITIDFSTRSEYTVKIYDLNSRLLISSRNTSKLDLSNFNQGIYLLKIETNKESYYQKLIIR